MKRFYQASWPLLACLLLLLGTAPARAQFLWQKAVGTALRGETAEFMIPVAGGFVTAGQSSNSTQFDDQGLYLSKVNYTGDTLWTHRIVFAGVNIFYPRGLIVDAAGNLIVSAITFTPPATSTAPPSVNQGLLIKLTPTGDTLWTRPVRSPAGSVLDVLVLGNDGSYVTIGSLGSLPLMRKFSPAGVLLWNQIVAYDNNRQGYLQNLVAVPNGYFLISSPNVGNIKSKYITVDEQGVYQFERVGSIYYPSRLQLDSQGNILATRGDLLKLTIQGDSIWSRSYQQYGRFLGLKQVIELPNGRYLAAGTRYNGPTRDIGFIVVDRNGTRLRDTLLVRAGDENVAGVALTPAGNYVVALDTDSGPIGRADQILFAYRNWDRLLPTRTAQPAPLAQLTAYPNPTTEAVTLEAADGRPLTATWVIYDLLGRAVQAGSLAGLPRARCSLAGLPTGRYLLRVADAQNHTTQTLRIEKSRVLIP